MGSVVASIMGRVRASGRGSVFTRKSFVDLGDPVSVGKALSELVRKGTLRRLARGLYDFPKTNSVIGVLSPHPEKVAQALSDALGTRIQWSDDYAANLLGLSDQVPAKICFVTDGRSRVVRIGNLEIKFHHVNPKAMATTGRVSGLVIQALRYLGPDYIDQRVIASLQRKLSAADKEQLLLDVINAPAWMRDHLRRIACGATTAG